MMRNTISERAILARLNQKWAHEGQRVHRCRQNAGAVDPHQNTITATHMGMVATSCEANVLRDNEKMEA